MGEEPGKDQALRQEEDPGRVPSGIPSEGSPTQRKGGRVTRPPSKDKKLSNGLAFYLHPSFCPVSLQKGHLADGHSLWKGGPLQPTEPSAKQWPQKLSSATGEVEGLVCLQQDVGLQLGA